MLLNSSPVLGRSKERAKWGHQTLVGSSPPSMDAASIATANIGSRLAASSSIVPHFLSTDQVRAAPSLGLRCCFDRSVGLGLSVNQRLERFAMNCCGDGERDMRSAALAEGIADSLEISSLGMDLNKEPSISTILTTFGNSFDPYGALSTPLYQTSTFKQPSATENGLYDYTRSGNPTRDVLQSLLAKLEKADRAFCFTSGMAALSTIISLIVSGQEIVAGEDIYGGSDRLLSQVVPRNGIVVKRVDTSDLHEVASAIGPNTKLVWLESPTNPRIQIADICVILWFITLLN